MAEPKLDLRVAKTYDALFSAFEQLLDEKPFEQISVTELCDRARTRRATFYKHFGDKYEFFSFMIEALRERFMAEGVAAGRKLSGRAATEAMVRHGLVFVEENERLIRSLQRSNLLFSLMDLNAVASDEIAEVAKQLLPLHAGADERPGTIRGNLRIRFAQGALASCALWWLDNRGKVDKDVAVGEIVDLLGRL